MMFAPEPGFVSLFNGHDLTAGVSVDFGRGHPASQQAATRRVANREGAGQFRRQTASYDGVTCEKRTPHRDHAVGRRKIQKLSDHTGMFRKNFILNFNSGHPDADSGVFHPPAALQCRDYLLAGPYKQLKHYKPQDGTKWWWP